MKVIDFGASRHWVAVPPHLADATGAAPVREIGAMTDDLDALARWRVTLGVDTVAVKSTGVYRIPVCEVLEQHGLMVLLVDARQLKYMPDRSLERLNLAGWTGQRRGRVEPRTTSVVGSTTGATG